MKEISSTRKASKSNRYAESSAFISRLREGIAIFLLAMAGLLFVSFITYDGSDPGWSQTALDDNINNSAGQIGAWLADLCIYFFGYMAYLFPLLIIYFCCALLILEKIIPEKKDNNSTKHSGLLRVLRVLGILSILVGGCGLLSLQGSLGGVLGNSIQVVFIKYVNYIGASLILSVFFLVGITLTTGLSWLKLLSVSGQIVIMLIIKMIKIITVLVSVIVNKIRAHRKQRRATRVVRKKLITPVIQSPINKSVNKPVKQLANQKIIQKKDKINFNSKSSSKYSKELPNVNLLDEVMPSDSEVSKYTPEDLEQLSRDVEARLLDFSVIVKVVSVCPGPIITRFELSLAPGVKVSKISGLAKDLARSLSVTSVRVVEVIPGKAVVGLEIPNQSREIVRLREIIDSSVYLDSASPLTLALGKDISGLPVTADLSKMPHLLVAGTTGSGKSVGVNAMLLSILFKSTPEEVRLVLIDPKMLELSIYEGIGHLLTPVVTDMKDATKVLNWCVAEMERRYQLMAAIGVRNLIGYNNKITQAKTSGAPIKDPLFNLFNKSNKNKSIEEEIPELEKLPYIVVIIDEFADLMMVVGKNVEQLIARIAQKARAAGIHMILATQRPSVDVITGLIKANVPTRIGFQVSSKIDSRTILDQQGAEQLLGHGDMLYLAPGTGIPVRVHGAFVSDDEVHRVAKSLKENGPKPDYIDEISSGSLVNINGFTELEEQAEQDPLYDEAVFIVTESRKASISHLQRRLKIGYNRSARLIEEMEAGGIVTAMQTNGTREVLAAAAPKD